MIYDIFLFHSELDILEIRLNILADQVDKFVIVECDEDFKGKKKPLVFLENVQRFKKWAHKIEHYVIRDVMGDSALIEQAKKSSTTGAGELQWIREFYMKESIKKFLTHLDDDDICVVSDVDEIWEGKPILNKRFRLKVYCYHLNVGTNEYWLGGFITSWKILKEGSLNDLKSSIKEPIEGGWHFTYQGTRDQIRKKFESAFSGQAYGGQSIEQLMSHVENLRDYLGRPFTFFMDESKWPEYLKNNRERYKHLLL